MQITFNGLSQEIREGVTVGEALRILGEPVTHVIVEVNGNHIEAEDYEKVRLNAGDRVEAIFPAFGG